MQTYKAFVLVCVVAGATCGCASFGRHEPTVALRFHEEVSAAMPENVARPVDLPKYNLRVIINPYPTLSERDIISAAIYPTAGGDAIALQFDTHGIVVLDELTTRNRGHYIVVLYNDRPVAAWQVNRRLETGQFILEGDFTDAEAHQIVDAINKVSGKHRDFGDVP